MQGLKLLYGDNFFLSAEIAYHGFASESWLLSEAELRDMRNDLERCNSIEFGNIQDESAVVTKKQNDPRAYGMLSQLNVKPRTMYLAKIRNTPERLMTSIQLADLQTYGTPKAHGAGHGDAHGDSQGTGHGDEHSHDHDHAEDKAATS